MILNKISRKSGFTLIEIMLAIFIFGIVMATVFGSFRSATSVTEAVDGYTDVYQMASNCLNRMITDVRAVYIETSPAYKKPSISDDEPSAYRVEGKVGEIGGGDFPSLRFTSRAHIGLGGDERNGIAQIIYYVEYNEREEMNVLKRSDILSPYPKDFKPEVGDPILCEKVKSLEFTYYDEEGEESDTWNSESQKIKYATPRAVKVKVEVGDESDSLFFETMIEFPVFRDEVK